LIQFTVCGIVAREQMVMGAVANPKFLTVEKLSKIFSSEHVRLKCQIWGWKLPFWGNFGGKVKCWASI